MINAKDFSKIVNKRPECFEQALNDWLEDYVADRYKEGVRVFQLPNLPVGDCIDSLRERGFHVGHGPDDCDVVELRVPPQAR